MGRQRERGRESRGREGAAEVEHQCSVSSRLGRFSPPEV